MVVKVGYGRLSGTTPPSMRTVPSFSLMYVPSLGVRVIVTAAGSSGTTPGAAFGQKGGGVYVAVGGTADDNGRYSGTICCMASGVAGTRVTSTLAGGGGVNAASLNASARDTFRTPMSVVGAPDPHAAVSPMTTATATTSCRALILTSPPPLLRG